MKSRAPRRIASTASSTLAHAVMMTTGSVGSIDCSRLRRSSPSFPLVVVPGVVEVDERQGVVAPLDRLDRRRGRFHRLGLVALVLQQEAQRLDDVGVVIGDQDAMGWRAGHAWIQVWGLGGDERQTLSHR